MTGIEIEELIKTWGKDKYEVEVLPVRDFLFWAWNELEGWPEKEEEIDIEAIIKFLYRSWVALRKA